MDLDGIGVEIKIKTQIRTEVETKIKIRAEIPMEDKESGLTITTTSEIVAEATIVVGALHRTQDTHKDGTTNPCSLNNYNHK